MEQGLCDLCRGLSVESLTRPEGYQHVATGAELRESAKACKMCKIIDAALTQKKPEEGSTSGALICRLHVPEEGSRSKAVLGVTGFRKRGFVRIYTHGT